MRRALERRSSGFALVVAFFTFQGCAEERAGAPKAGRGGGGPKAGAGGKAGASAPGARGGAAGKATTSAGRGAAGGSAGKHGANAGRGDGGDENAGDGGRGHAGGGDGGHAALGSAARGGVSGAALGGTSSAGGGTTSTAGTAGSASGGTSAAGASGETSAGGAAGASGETSAGGAGAGGEAGGTSACVAFEPPGDCVASSGPLPDELRCTGLYADWATRELACGVVEFKPAFELWSDGAKKRRFVSLPPGATVDVSDPDNWRFPVGTRFWKEFSVGDEAQRVRGETRLLEKSAGGWLYTTYVWSEDGARADQMNDGVEDLFGTGHAVPTRDQCRECHSGRPDFVLGWDALMLGAGATGVTLGRLADSGLLSGTLPAAAVPGDSIERSALGYLHANCGVSCHNTTDEAPARSSGLFLRLELGTLASVHETNAAVTGVNKIPDANVALPPGGPYYDLRPLDPGRSLVIERMSRRDEFSMPRLGTRAIDPTGIAAVTAWVESMTAERGYPAAEP